MGDRGSKSEQNSVKEQRVDGSSVINLLFIIVRCTLVAGKPAFEREIFA